MKIWQCSCFMDIVIITSQFPKKKVVWLGLFRVVTWFNQNINWIGYLIFRMSISWKNILFLFDGGKSIREASSSRTNLFSWKSVSMDLFLIMSCQLWMHKNGKPMGQKQLQPATLVSCHTLTLTRQKNLVAKFIYEFL